MPKEQKPQFDRDPFHKFAENEKIYVIDDNGFDIYEAIIKQVRNGIIYDVEYPDYPDDNFSTVSTARFLLRTEKNKAIYEQQEAIRVAKEYEEEEDYQDTTYGTEDSYALSESEEENRVTWSSNSHCNHNANTHSNRMSHNQSEKNTKNHNKSSQILKIFAPKRITFNFYFK